MSKEILVLSYCGEPSRAFDVTSFSKDELNQVFEVTRKLDYQPTI